MTTSAVILYLKPPAGPQRVGGLPLLARQLKELYKLGIRHCQVLGVESLPQTIPPHCWPPDMVVTVSPNSELPNPTQDLPGRLRDLMAPTGDFLLVRGEWVIDPRLLHALMTSTRPQWLQTSEASDALPIAARLSTPLLALWANPGVQAWLEASPRLDPESLDTYQPSHRGPKPFYLQAVSTPKEAETATQTVIQAAQKKSLDLPALLIHPFFENRIVRALCETPITPNHVTLFTALLGAVVAALFWHGWLRLGIPLAYVVAILDGVDGKLARTTLRTSRLGEVEHVLDFFVEHAWYFSLMMFFATGDTAAWWVGGGLMAGDLLDKLLYMTGHLTVGKQLDELGSFDRTFRLIAGRRNIYLWMFMIGFWSGFPWLAFTAACTWALCTAAVHSARLAMHLLRQRIALAHAPDLHPR